MAGIDISGLLSKAAEVGQSAGITGEHIAANAAAAYSAAQDSARLEQEAGVNEAIEKTTAATGILQREQSTQQTALNLGLRTGDPTGGQAELAKQLLDAQSQRSAALEKVNAKKAVSITSDPIGWLLNQFTINDDIEAHNAANDRISDIESKVAETNKLLDSQYQADLRQQTTVTAGSIAATAAKTAALAQIKANSTMQAAYAANSAAYMNIQQMDVEQLHAIGTAVQAQQSQEQLRIAQEHLALSKEEFSWKKIEKEKGEAASKYVIDTINRGRQVIDPTLPPLDPMSPKILALISGKTPLDGELKVAFERGEENNRVDPNGNSTRILGHSVTDFLRTQSTTRPYYSPDQATLAAKITQIATEAKSMPEYKNFEAAKDAAGAEKYINDYVHNKINDYAERVTDADNPYYLPSIDTLADAKHIPGIAQLPTYQKVIAPAVAAGVNVSDPNKVMALVVQAVGAGVIKPNDAAVDIASAYKAGQMANIASKQFSAMGVAPTVQYNVPLKLSGLVSTDTNLADPNDVLRAISVELSSKLNISGMVKN